MAEAPHLHQPLLDTDPEFEPRARPRSCTWPLPRPDASPPPEEQQQQAHQQQHQHQQQQQQHPQHPPQQPQQQHAQPARKSSASRRNAWGNMSYADLITKAIESSPEKRLTLSQIYDWMVKSVPYFKDKGDSNSSAGWKNSIRHNLSLHSRFVRVQNEGTGKSSWWMLNPEGGKNGKSPRRRAASMDNNSKFAKSRGRAAKKKVSHQGGDGGADSPASQFSVSNDNDFESWTSFRPRTSSNASTLSGRLSPFLPEQDDLSEGELHMVYPSGPSGGGGGASKLPSLSEVSGSLGEKVMENLLDNLNLLSPAGGGVTGGSNSSQSSPGYPSYSSPQPPAPAQQDYRPSLYGGVASLPPLSPYMGQYNCPPGLLKELLTSDPDPHCDLMSPVPQYPQPHTQPRPHLQAPPTVNGHALHPQPYLTLNGYGRQGAHHLHTHQQHHHHHNHHHHPLHPNHHHHHHHHPHQEKLPSDLDDMSIERFECDVESVLHDTLMDGDALDFNFDPMVSQQGFVHGVKTSTHHWVSG